MLKKKIITIILSVVLCISVGILGFVNLFRIDSVSLDTSTLQTSEESVSEVMQYADDLLKELEDAYITKNTLFSNKKTAESILKGKKEYSYFRITEFRKKFPNQIVVEVKEDEEMFALEHGTGYYILSADGIYLASSNENYKRDEYKGKNIQVSIKKEGVSAVVDYGTVVAGHPMVDGFVKVVKAMAATPGMEGNLRSNVRSIELIEWGSNATQIRITMREGVVAYIFDYEKDTETKVAMMMEKYLALEDSQKVTGMVFVQKDSKGAWKVDYNEVDVYALAE